MKYIDNLKIQSLGFALIYEALDENRKNALKPIGIGATAGVAGGAFAASNQGQELINSGINKIKSTYNNFNQSNNQTQPQTQPVNNQTTQPVNNQTTQPVNNQTTQPVNNQTTQPANNQTTQPANNQTTQPVNNQDTGSGLTDQRFNNQSLNRSIWGKNNPNNSSNTPTQQNTAQMEPKDTTGVQGNPVEPFNQGSPGIKMPSPFGPKTPEVNTNVAAKDPIPLDPKDEDTFGGFIHGLNNYTRDFMHS